MFIHHRSALLFPLSSPIECRYLQFQKRKVGVAVISLTFALLCDVFLENLCGLGVVPIEAVEDRVDVLGSIGSIVKGGHGGGIVVGGKVVVVDFGECRCCRGRERREGI